MGKYKVGDVAALFSKPKSPTTTGGKKLQSLFQDYYSKQSKSTLIPQEKNSEIANGDVKEMNNQNVSQKSRKRKFSSSNDSELNENVSSKKFKESFEQEFSSKSDKNDKEKKFKKQKHFPKKNSNDIKLNHNDDKKIENFKMQQDFPRKDKKSKKNSFNSSSVFPKFEVGDDSENGNEFQSVSKSKNIEKSNFQNKNLIKKSKKKQSFDHDNDILSNDVLDKDSDDNEDVSLKKEIKAFLDNAGKEEMESHDNIKKEKSFNWKKEAAVEKQKNKFLEKENTSLMKYENSPEHNVKSKKKNKQKNHDQQDFQRTKSEGNLYSFNKSEANLKYDGVKQNSQSKKLYSLEDDNVKHSEKPEHQSNKQKAHNQQDFPRNKSKTKIKHGAVKQNSPSKKIYSIEEDNVKESEKRKCKLNKQKAHEQQDFPRTKSKAKIKHDGVKQNSASKKLYSLEQDNIEESGEPEHESDVANSNSFLTSENNSETSISNAKGMGDFVRKPKVKIDLSKVFDPKSKLFSTLQKKGIKGIEMEAPEYIQLPNLSEDWKQNKEEELSRTLFVNNLPKSISKQQLRNLFSRFGNVVSARLPGVETDKAKIFGKNPPKLLHSNYASETLPAFVVFKQKEHAEDALKASGFVFQDHHITVDLALPAGTHKIYDSKRSIFIGNLPFNVKDESIWDAFSHCGTIEGVRVVRDRQTGLGKGFGYVLFHTVEAKQKALALESLNIDGRDIRIKAVDSNNKKKASKSDTSSFKRDTFKRRAIRIKKNSQATSGHKSIRKLTNKQKMLHKKKKTAEILQKAMK